MNVQIAWDPSWLKRLKHLKKGSSCLTSIKRCLFVISYVTFESVTLALGTCVAKLQCKIKRPWLQFIVNFGEAETILVDCVV